MLYRNNAKKYDDFLSKPTAAELDAYEKGINYVQPHQVNKLIACHNYTRSSQA
jgi:hypothetical protein